MISHIKIQIDNSYWLRQKVKVNWDSMYIHVHMVISGDWSVFVIMYLLSMVKHQTSCMNSACPPTSSQIPCSRSYMWPPDNRNLDSIFKFYIICKYSTWQMTIAIASKPSNIDWLEEESKMTKQLWISTKSMSKHKICCLP